MSRTVRAALIVHLKSYKILTDEPHRSTGHGRRCDLRIATWNIERLKHKKSLEQILLACEQIQADILVLTETDHRVCPDYQYSFHTPPLAEIQPVFYSPTENRVSIYTNYPCVRQHKTCDVYTALCVELETKKPSTGLWNHHRHLWKQTPFVSTVLGPTARRYQAAVRRRDACVYLRRLQLQLFRQLLFYEAGQRGSAPHVF